MHFVDNLCILSTLNPQMPMITTITFSVLLLVVFNFFLLKFSCNKATIKKNKLPINTYTLNTQTTIEQENQRLAPTGS